MTQSSLHVVTSKNFISLAKVEQQAKAIIYAQKLPSGFIEIIYIGTGIVRSLQSASILAPRMIASLLGANYDDVTLAMEAMT